MSDHTEKIKEKIRAMLRLAENDAAAEGEVRNALAFAARLMDEHNLSAEDLDDNDRVAIDLEWSEFARGRAETGSRSAAEWEKWLGQFVGDFVGGVSCYIDNPAPSRGAAGVRLDRHGQVVMTRGVVFYGVAEDVALASELYGEIRVAVAAMGRLRWGGVYRGPGRSYCEGFVDGLSLDLHHARETERKKLAEQGGRSLVVLGKRRELIRRKAEAGRDWLAKQGVSLCHRSASSCNVSFDAEARSQGLADGREYSPSKERRLKLPSPGGAA